MIKRLRLSKKLSLFLLGAAITFCPVAKAQQQATVFLGSAASFAVLGASTVTNTGNTVVNGNLGVSPGTAITGFGPGVVNGTINAGNMVAAHAQASLAIAFKDAAGRKGAGTELSGDLSGLTLTPGRYYSTSTLKLSGNVTLHGKGIYIFQIASGLTTTGGAVVLSGGADAADVFWQVGSSATFAGATAFKGTIMAYASISFTAGCTLNGRALAENGAVTLIDSNITLALGNTIVIELPPPPSRD